MFGGQVKNAWFDIATFADRTVGEEAQKEGLKESCGYLRGLIDECVAELARQDDGVNEDRRKNCRERVVLGGFSQGCAMGVMVVLSQMLEVWGKDGGGQGLPAFVGLSGWLPFRRQIDEVLEGKGLLERKRGLSSVLGDVLGGDEDEWVGEEGLQTKVFLGHGEMDEKMRLLWGEQMRDTLRSLGMDVQWMSYKECGHLWNGRGEMEDLVAFLKGKGFGEKEERIK